MSEAHPVGKMLAVKLVKLCQTRPYLHPVLLEKVMIFLKTAITTVQAMNRQ